ncbi:hypothetical protein AN958_08175 [Leucoagaricus sp. SymC.cos]|nr:hypothetical protein AN958_08175 [Leucoagaricus sp. SymC.cos]
MHDKLYNINKVKEVKSGGHENDDIRSRDSRGIENGPWGSRAPNSVRGIGHRCSDVTDPRNDEQEIAGGGWRMDATSRVQPCVYLHTVLHHHHQFKMTVRDLGCLQALR